MYQTAIEKVGEFLSGVNPLILFSFVVLFGLFVFWKGCIQTRKDNSSTFDIFILSFLFGLIAGRISYVISNWSEFSSYIWYWLPYEKYGEEIFLFRVLPWRFLRVWDWGIDILAMFVAFALAASLAVLVIKKWKWSHMFSNIFFTLQTMIGSSFLLLGAISSNTDWVSQGGIMLMLLLILFLLKNSVRKIMIGKKETKILMTLDIFFIILMSICIAYSYISAGISFAETIGLGVFLFWTLIGTVMYVSDSRKGSVTIEKVSSVREISQIDINQPIKLPK